MPMSDLIAELYPAHLDVVKQRAANALTQGGFDRLVVFSGAPFIQFLDDSPYPFKTNPHFKAWLPLTENPFCFLVYTPGDKPVLVYYQPSDYWHKTPDAPDGYWVEHFDVRLVTETADAKAHLQPNGGQTAFIGEWQDEFSDWNLGEKNPEAIINALHYERAAKSEYEIECMRRANALGARAHRRAEQAFRSGASEYEIHQAYVAACQHTDEELPYGNIIALNEHGATLHYQHLERTAPASIRSFLIDAGASYLGYAADITRTYSFADQEFAGFIDAVDRMQQSLCAAVRPGVDFRDLHVRTHREIAGILSDWKIVKLSADDVIETGIISTFFPHGLGHLIGLQVHDVGGFMKDSGGETIPQPEGHPYLRLTRELDVDFVVTIEPGIYFIDPLLEELRQSEHAGRVDWARVETFRRFGGVRIEDDVRVTEDGHENLTRDQFALELAKE